MQARRSGGSDAAGAGALAGNHGGALPDAVTVGTEFAKGTSRV
ncbi:17 kDa surface antigen (fragment) [Burkholderiales bacterium]